MTIVFNWLCMNGRDSSGYHRGDRVVENWFSHDLHRHRRYVYNAFKAGCAFAVDLERREAQIVWFKNGERRVMQFAEIGDDNIRDAIDVVVMAQDVAVHFPAAMFLRWFGYEDIADEITRGAVDDLKPEPKL